MIMILSRINLYLRYLKQILFYSMFKRSNIDIVNNKNHIGPGFRSPVIAPSMAGRSPIKGVPGPVIGTGPLRPSMVPASQLGKVPILGQQVARPAVVNQSVIGERPGVSGRLRRSLVGASPVFGVSPPIYNRRSFVGEAIPVSTIRRDVGSHIGGPVVGATGGRVSGGQVIISGSIGGQLRRSFANPVSRLTAVQSPQVIQVVQNPPIYEAVTTPGRVIEIVQPIVEITPDIVTARKVSQIITPPPTIIPRKARGARGHYQDVRIQHSCPWWLWALLGLLLLLGLLAGLAYLFRDQLGFTKDEEVKVQKNITERTKPIESIEPVVPQSKQPEPQQLQQQANIDPKQNGKGVVPDQKQLKKTSNEFDKGQDIPLRSGGNLTENAQADSRNTTSLTSTNITCQMGYFFHKNKCIACPNGSIWNGEKCVKKVLVEQPIENQTEQKTESKNQTSPQTPSTPQPTPTDGQTTQTETKTTTQQKLKTDAPRNENTETDVAKQLNIQDPWSVVKSPQLNPSLNVYLPPPKKVQSTQQTQKEQVSNFTTTQTKDANLNQTCDNKDQKINEETNSAKQTQQKSSAPQTETNTPQLVKDQNKSNQTQPDATVSSQTTATTESKSASTPKSSDSPSLESSIASNLNQQQKQKSKETKTVTKTIQSIESTKTSETKQPHHHLRRFM